MEADLYRPEDNEFINKTQKDIFLKSTFNFNNSKNTFENAKRIRVYLIKTFQYQYTMW